jgi:hypothetical protein
MRWVSVAAGTFVVAAALLPPAADWYRKCEQVQAFRAARDRLRVGMTEAEVGAAFADSPATRWLCLCGPDAGTESWAMDLGGGSVRVWYDRGFDPDRRVAELDRPDPRDPALLDSVPNPRLTTAVAGSGAALVLMGLRRRPAA